jgi:enolase
MADERTSKAVENEREEIEQYMAVHGLEPQLNSVVNEIVRDRPEDPFATMAQSLLVKSERASLILGVSARETLSAQGYPALEVSVNTIHGTFTAQTAIGPFDGDARWDGRGLKKSVDAVTHLIQDKLVGREMNQAQIDAFLSSEPNVPENVILATSMACCRAGAKQNDMPLHAFIATLANVVEPTVPIPAFSVVNGADWGDSPLHLQELTVMFVDAPSFESALEDGVKLQQCLRSKFQGLGHRSVNTGMHGGLVPSVVVATEAMQAVQDAAADLGLGKSVRFGASVCASMMAGGGEGGEGGDGSVDEGVVYDTSKWAAATGAAAAQPPKTGEELADMYLEWMTRFRFNSVDDIFHQVDTDSFMKFKERLDTEIARTKEKMAKMSSKKGKKHQQEEKDDGGDPVIPFEAVGNDVNCSMQLVGNDICRTGDDVERYHEEQTVNTLVLTLRKGRTVTGCIELAANAQRLGWGVVASSEPAHEGAETMDDFIAHLAVGTKAGQFRAGGLGNGENLIKYNTLLRIATDELHFVPYSGAKFRFFQG